MESQGIPYFSLMCQQNEQWDEIETEYGLKGFAILVKLYQKIFSSNGYYCQWTKEVEQAFAQKNCGLPKNSQLVSNVIQSAIKRGLFSNTLFQKYQILTSVDIQKQYLHVVKKRPGVKIKNEYLLVQFAQNSKNVDTEGENQPKKEYKIIHNTKSINTYGTEPDTTGSVQQQNTQTVFTLPLKGNANHTISQSDIQALQELYPTVDILQQLRHMKGWLQSNPTKRKTCKGIERFVHNWLANYQNQLNLPTSQHNQTAAKQSRFVNYPQRQWDFEELARLERERLEQKNQQFDITTNP